MWKFLRGGATFIPGATSIPESRVLLGHEEANGPKKNGDKSCQSNFDKRSSDFGSFLVI